jgi:hypothetical protein
VASIETIRGLGIFENSINQTRSKLCPYSVPSPHRDLFTDEGQRRSPDKDHTQHNKQP